MAKRNKDWKHIWRAAANRTELSNAVIKEFKKVPRKYASRTPLVISDKHNTIRIIREAWHNPRTKTSAAFLALASRFERMEDITKELADAGIRGSRAQVRLVHSKKYGYYFRLETTNDEGDSRVFNPNRRMVEGMKQYQPKAAKSPQLLESIRSGDVRSQNVNIFKNELSTFIVALTDMIATCAAMHDPKNLFGSDLPDLPKHTLLEEEDVKGTPNLDRYFRDLQHMRSEWEKFLPVGNKLGLDVSSITTRLDELITEGTILADDYMDVDPTLTLYEIHEMGFEVIEKMHEMAIDIQNMDLDDSALKGIRKNMSTPVFRDYSHNKMRMHRTDVGGVIERMETLANKVPKHEFTFKKD